MSDEEKKRELGPGEKPVVRRRYVHMMPEDYEAWSAYLVSERNELLEVWYDVHVGEPMHVPAGAPEYMKNVAEGVSRKRIDVVGRSAQGIFVIEVKPWASMQALGQVVTYTNLYVREFEIHGSVQAMIVAMECDRDILETAQTMNVKIVALKGVLL
jgi:hypothetical protein